MKEKGNFKNRILRTAALFLMASLIFCTACNQEEEVPTESETEKKQQESYEKPSDAVFELGDPEDIVFPGDEEEEEIFHPMKTHDEATTLEHYQDVFYVTSPLGVYLRESPNSSSKILGFIPEKGGGSCINQSVSTTWYQVNSGPVKGYVSSGSIVVGPVAEKLASENSEERVRILEKADVYLDALSGEKIGTVGPDEVYDYIEEEREYYHIRLSEDADGYIVKTVAEEGLFLAEAFDQPMTGVTICLDPLWSSIENVQGEDPVGPGSSTMVDRYGTGAVGPETGIPEYSVNLMLARVIKKELTGRGYRVFMTRNSNDSTLGRMERAQAANETGADFTIHLCCDSSRDTRITGTSVYYPAEYVPAALSNASKIYADVLSGFLDDNAGERISNSCVSGSFPEMNFTECSTIVLQMGYLTSPADEKNLNDPAYQHMISKSIADALDRYYGFKR